MTINSYRSKIVSNVACRSTHLVLHRFFNFRFFYGGPSLVLGFLFWLCSYFGFPVVQLAKPNPSNPHVLNMKDQELGHGQLVFPLFKGEFPFWLPYFIGYNIISQLFSISCTWIILYKTDTPLPVKYLLVIVGDLAGGSRISSGELDDADDVEGFSLRVLKKGVCIDHF